MQWKAAADAAALTLTVRLLRPSARRRPAAAAALLLNGQQRIKRRRAMCARMRHVWHLAE